MYKKACKVCGDMFSTQSPERKWCNKFCRTRIRTNISNKKNSIVKKCVACGNDFITCKGNKKYCSPVCTNKLYREKTNRYVKNGIEIPTGSVGAMSEMYVAGYLLENGYSVFRAMSPSCYCDLIAKKNGKTLEVEVRTGYMSTDNKLSFPTLLRGSADTYGVWERNTHEVFFLDKDKKKVKI